MPFSAHAVATTNKFIRKETLAMMRKRAILALLNDRGRFIYNDSGTNIQWPVRNKRNPLTAYGDGDSVTFVRRDKREKAELRWAAYTMSESINEFDKRMNSGQEAIVKLWSNKVKELTEDYKDLLPNEIINTDGNASGSEKKMHGLESIFGGSASSGNLVGTNNDSYAGLSTVRGQYGGSITGTWPTGTISGPEYDFWSPLLVDYGDSGWSATTDNWLNNCVEALRFAIIHTERNGDKINLFLLGKTLYRQFLDAASAKENIFVQRSMSDSTMVKLGFTGVNFDGKDITWEDTVGSTVGYGLSIDTMNFRLLGQSQLVEAKADYDIETQSDRLLLRMFGNLQIESPRSQCKLLDY